jgi:DNA-binding transcriptional LysR family regulator
MHDFMRLLIIILRLNNKRLILYIHEKKEYQNKFAFTFSQCKNHLSLILDISKDTSENSSDMRNHLPPMQALRCFEATARFSSISKAADELCVTQGAVSKQIKLLESFLNVLLFERTTQGVKLTKLGQQYLVTVINALDTLDSGAQALQQHPRTQQLLVDAIPSLCNIWLIPRLYSFEQRYPHLKVNLSNGDGAVNFSQSQADIAIRCLPVDQQKSHYTQLFKENFVLVGAPKLLLDKPIKKPLDVLQHRLIQQSTRAQLWDHFLIEKSISYHAQSLDLGMAFQHFYMSLKAAQEGLGLALIPDFLAADAIADKSVINPLNLSMKSQYCYFAICPEHKSDLHRIVEFKQWLSIEVI